VAGSATLGHGPSEVASPPINLLVCRDANIGGSSVPNSTDQAERDEPDCHRPLRIWHAAATVLAKRRVVTLVPSHRTAEGLRPRGHIELGKFRITIMRPSDP